MSQPASTQNRRPYLGYPYSNPPVIDPPSFNAAEVAALQKYANLPRRQLVRPGASTSTESVVSDAVPKSPTKEEDEERPVVYIDLPEEEETAAAAGTAAAATASSEEEEEERPVVYIEIPDSNGSGVSQRLTDETEATFVQDTILYDPFKDTMINVGSAAPGSSAGPSRPAPSRPAPSRPAPPTSLNIASPGTSAGSSYTPSFLSKEAYIYGSPQTSNDGFSLSPLPVNEFPPPPPPYEEVDSRVEPPRVPDPEPPRTQVILPARPAPASPTITFDGTTRKLMQCQQCHSTVETVVVKRYGFWTHVMGIIVFFIFPLLLYVYLSDSCKYKDHYCPYCNKLIAEEPPPVCGSEISYVS